MQPKGIRGTKLLSRSRMSLDELRQLGDSSGSKGNSSGNSGGGFPKSENRVPYALLWRDSDGVLHFAHRPQSDNLTLEFVKESESDSYELKYVPEHIERFWMSPDSFRYSEHVVKEVLGMDLREKITEAPETALQAIDESAQVYDTEQEISDSRPCPVCSAQLHPVFDEFEQVNGKRVCSSHSLAEMKSAGLLESGGIPRNRLWE